MSDTNSKTKQSGDCQYPMPINNPRPVTASRDANAAGAVIGLVLLAALGAVLVGAASAGTNSSYGGRRSPTTPRPPTPLPPAAPPPGKPTAYPIAPGKPYPPPKPVPTKYYYDKANVAHAGTVRPVRRLPIVPLFVFGMALSIGIGAAVISRIESPEKGGPGRSDTAADRRPAQFPTTHAKTRPAATPGTPSRR